MQIDYKKLIKKYETNLVDKLRGFGEEDFLNFWVPASDDLNSIINLIDALLGEPGEPGADVGLTVVVATVAMLEE